jgi:hypothetical protein
MFSTLPKKAFSTKRLQSVAGTNHTESVEFLTDQRCFLQPLKDSELLGQGSFMQASKMFCERIDIKESDDVIIEGVEYSVQSINDFDYGSFPHKEVIVVRAK